MVYKKNKKNSKIKILDDDEDDNYNEDQDEVKQYPPCTRKAARNTINCDTSLLNEISLLDTLP